MKPTAIAWRLKDDAGHEYRVILIEGGHVITGSGDVSQSMDYRTFNPRNDELARTYAIDMTERMEEHGYTLTDGPCSRVLTADREIWLGDPNVPGDMSQMAALWWFIITRGKALAEAS